MVEKRKRKELPKRTEPAAVTAHPRLSDIGSNDHHNQGHEVDHRDGGDSPINGPLSLNAIPDTLTGKSADKLDGQHGSYFTNNTEDQSMGGLKIFTTLPQIPTGTPTLDAHVMSRLKMNAAIATAIAGVLEVKFAKGNYSGNNGLNRQITTGFTCSLVLVFNASDGTFIILYDTTTCFAWDEAAVSEDTGSNNRLHASNGFIVDHTGTQSNCNESGKTYRWWAIGA